tara:strand:- start:57 stop:485 length:429 start_codon:yes stop_codon:yes gene_type:complete
MVKIRKARKEDLKEISEIFRRESNKKPYFQGWTKRTALSNVSKSLKEEDVHVVMINGEIIGFITISLNEKKDVYIGELWLKSKYQRKGIGRLLMEFIEEKYRKKGSKLIKLTAKKKAYAVKFYKKLNYKIDREYVRMIKKLK